MVWSTAEEQDNAKDDQANDCDELDGSKVELGFTKNRDSNNVQHENDCVQASV